MMKKITLALTLSTALFASNALAGSASITNASTRTIGVAFSAWGCAGIFGYKGHSIYTACYSTTLKPGQSTSYYFRWGTSSKTVTVIADTSKHPNKYGLIAHDNTDGSNLSFSGHEKLDYNSHRTLRPPVIFY